MMIRDSILIKGVPIIFKAEECKLGERASMIPLVMDNHNKQLRPSLTRILIGGHRRRTHTSTFGMVAWIIDGRILLSDAPRH